MSVRLLSLATVGLVASAGVAPAQFFPRFGPQVPSGLYANSPFGGYYFNTYQSYQYTFTSTASGRPVTFSYQSSWSGVPLANNNYYYAAPVDSSNQYNNPYGRLSGGSGSFGSDANSPLVERQRAALARAQRASEWDSPVAGKKDDVDNWVAAQNRGDKPAAFPAIDPNLIDPADEAILSGKALNELLGVCLTQVKAERKAESGLCPPDLLENVAFAGGPAAAGVNLFRKPTLPYPAVTLVPETDKLRSAIDTEFTAIGQALRGGKKPTAVSLDRFDAAIAAARKALAVRLKDSPFAEEKEVNDFLTQLELAAKFAREPNAPSAFPAAWATSGATVAELVRFMDKFKLRFGPTGAGGEAAYLSLHRGLLGYYVRLTPVK